MIALLIALSHVSSLALAEVDAGADAAALLLASAAQMTASASAAGALDIAPQSVPVAAVLGRSTGDLPDGGPTGSPDCPCACRCPCVHPLAVLPRLADPSATPPHAAPPGLVSLRPPADPDLERRLRPPLA
jgi:hypothetical protein